MIDQSCVDSVKGATQIVDVAGMLGIAVKRSGNSYVGFCPFHNNTNTPSFAIFPNTGRWQCFGACGEGGDCVSLVQKSLGMNFPEAIKWLGAKVGIDVESGGDANFKQEFGALEAATAFYEKLLFERTGLEALQYLEDRGFVAETLHNFRIGYAPNGSRCTDHLIGLGYDVQTLEKIGISSKKGGRVFDRFRERVMIPIADRNGKTVGFGARALNSTAMPKYLNSPHSEIFNKSQCMFGISQASAQISATESVVVVEGYMDVMRSHQNGVRNCVSSMGTALTSNQLELISKRAKKIILAFDGDIAGRKAMIKGASTNANLPKETFVSGASGFIRAGSFYKTEFFAVPLPSGEDPDSLPGEVWRDLVSNPEPLIKFVIDSVISEKQRPFSPETQLEIANNVVPLIYQLNSPLHHDFWIEHLAKLLGANPHSLRTSVVPLPPLARIEPEVQTGGSLRLSRAGLLVSSILLCPSIIDNSNKLLQEAGVAKIAPADFQGWDMVIFSAIDNDRDLIRGTGWKSLEEGAVERITELLSVDWATYSPEETAEQLANYILDTRIETAKRHLSAIKQAQLPTLNKVTTTTMT